MKPLNSTTGFTLIEFIVGTVIVSIIAGIISVFYANRLLDYVRNDTRLILQSNTKQGIATVAKDIKYSQTIETNNRWPDNNAPSAPGNLYSWTSSTGSGATLILALPSLDTNGAIMYVDALHNTVQTDDVIYFIDSTTNILYRRTIANPVAGNAAKTTCPPAKVTASCPLDAKVVEDVADLILAYYDTNNILTTTPANAGEVEMTLKQTRVRSNRTYASQLTSRATLRNK